LRQLRLVGLAEDGASLVLESPTGESYRLPVDDRVRAACRGDLTRLGQIEIEMDNPLRPREIQMRVRAGESAEQVAASSGMPLDRVLRFASAVLQDRARVVSQARGTAIRPKSNDTLGALTEERLVGRGADPSTLAWDAWRGEDGGWLVRLTWRHGLDRGQGSDREHSARWAFDLARRTVRPDDPAAEQLSAEEFHARTITAVTPLAVAARAADEGRPRRGVEEVPRRGPGSGPGAGPGLGPDEASRRGLEELSRGGPEGSRRGPARVDEAQRARRAVDEAGRIDDDRLLPPVPDEPRAPQGATRVAAPEHPDPARPSGAEIRAGGPWAVRPAEPETRPAPDAPTAADIRSGGPRATRPATEPGPGTPTAADIRSGGPRGSRPGSEGRGTGSRPGGDASAPAGGARGSRAAGERPTPADIRAGGPRSVPRRLSEPSGRPDLPSAADLRGSHRRPGEAAEASAPDSEPEEEPRQVAAAGGATIPGMVVSGSDARETDEDRARRATVPSWDDILLGVRRRH
jgi:hypothetical protein